MGRSSSFAIKADRTLLVYAVLLDLCLVKRVAEYEKGAVKAVTATVPVHGPDSSHPISRSNDTDAHIRLVSQTPDLILIPLKLSYAAGFARVEIFAVQCLRISLVVDINRIKKNKNDEMMMGETSTVSEHARQVGAVTFLGTRDPN